MPEEIIEHDTWNHSPPKLAKQSKIELGHIEGVLPFDGVRNPGSRSSVSHRIWLTYRTAANDYKPKVGIAESAAEAAVGHEVLLDPNTYDVRFQPVTVRYENEFGQMVTYNHDLMSTALDGYRRLFFVRNGASLSKPKTWRDIYSIAAATPRHVANDMVVVNADDYSRQRRENLFRMHELVLQPDEEADEAVLWTARNLKTLWHMRDLFAASSLPQHRVFRSCYRLIARKHLVANLDHVIAEYSRVELAA